MARPRSSLSHLGGHRRRQRSDRGFTIVELLIVIVVIAILAAITIVAYNGIQARSRDTIRINDLKQIQKVVELYKAENGSYPLGAGGSGVWSGRCGGYGGYKTYILNVQNYMPNEPLDPKSGDTPTQGCYLYRSNGTDYMILAWFSMETVCGGDPSNSCNPPSIQALDRPAYVEPTIAIYSPGARNW